MKDVKKGEAQKKKKHQENPWDSSYSNKLWAERKEQREGRREGQEEEREERRKERKEGDREGLATQLQN